MKIWDYAIKHPVVIAIVLITVIIFGGLSLSSLKQDLISGLALPNIAIGTVYPGAGPTDVEREVTDVLEQKFSSVQGVSSMESFSQPSFSLIILKFTDKVNINDQLNEVRALINGSIGDLPSTIKGAPQAKIMSSNLYPILTVQIESSLDKFILSDYIKDKVLPQMYAIPGMATIKFFGGVDRQVDIVLDLEKIDAKEISIIDIFKLLNYSNITFPAGDVTYQHKKLNIRTEGKFKDLNDIENLVVGYKEDEKTFILLKDVATINLLDKKPDKYVNYDDEDIVVFEVLKRVDGDSIAIIKECKKIFEKIKQETGGVIRFHPVMDNSADINFAINAVKSSAISGAILAILIIFLFLHNIRTTVIVGVSIPLSIVISFVMMKLAGLNLNLMTLGGLTVAIGMIVDASIVILENIFTHFSKGVDRKEAASLGAGEVGGAVIASTATTLAVFIPILFLSGLVGSILKDVSLTIVFALIASTVVAVSVVPWMSSLLLKHSDLQKSKFGSLFETISDKIDGVMDFVKEKYKLVLIVALNNKKFVLVFAFMILILSVFVMGLLGFSFLPSVDMNDFEITINTPAGFSIDDTKAKIGEIEKIVHEVIPELEAGYFYTALDGKFNLISEPTKGYAKLRLKRLAERPKVNGKVRKIQDIIPVLQKEISTKITDVNITVLNGGLDKMMSFATGGSGFRIDVSGNNFKDVEQASLMVKDILDNDPEIYKSELNVSLNQFEIVNDLTLQYLSYLGITPFEAGLVSRIIFNGMQAGIYRDGNNKSYPINLTSALAGNVITQDVLNKIKLKNSKGTFISFENLSNINVVKSVDKIPHVNRLKSIAVTGYQRGEDLSEVTKRVKEKLQNSKFSRDVKWEIGGTSELIADSMNSLIYVLLIAIYLVYFVMVVQFERFTQPFIVLVSIPFIFIGVGFTLFVFNTTISLVSMLGIIALAGTVVNNAIVLIDYSNLLRQSYGQDLYSAVINGAASRLKPILMTTLTTVIGVIPMAFSRGEGGELLAPLGRVIAGGLLSSTLVTLFIIPIIYYVLENRIEKKRIVKNK